MNRFPPLQRWWVTYLLVGALAVIATLWGIATVAGFLAPVRHILLVLLFATIFAFLLSPFVEFLKRFIPRPIAIAIAFFGALALVVFGSTFIATPLVQESRGLVERVPEYVRTLQSDDPIAIAGVEIPGALRRDVGLAVAERAGDLVERSAALVVGFAIAIVDVVLVLVLSLYLIAAWPKIRSGLLYVLPPKHRPGMERFQGDVANVFGRYVRGQLLLGLVIGLANLIAFSLIGLPYAVLLAVLAGILELIPIIGPIVAGAVASMVALFQPEPIPLVIWVILAATLIQQLENHILVPRISGGAVGIHPLAALLSVLVGVQLFGIIGGLFAVPVAGFIALYGGRWLSARPDDEAVPIRV